MSSIFLILLTSLSLQLQAQAWHLGYERQADRSILNENPAQFQKELPARQHIYIDYLCTKGTARQAESRPSPSDPLFRRLQRFNRAPDSSLLWGNTHLDLEKGLRYHLAKGESDLYMQDSLAKQRVHRLDAWDRQNLGEFEACEAYWFEHKKRVYRVWLHSDLPPTLGLDLQLEDSLGQLWGLAAWASLDGRDTGFLYRALPLAPQDLAEQLALPKAEQVLNLYSVVPDLPAIGPLGEMLRAGQDIPDFAFEDIEGKLWRKSDLQGRVVVFNFWFISCAPCRAEIPQLNALCAKYPDLLFLAPALNSASGLRDFRNKVRFDYKIIAQNPDFFRSWGIRSYPQHLIMDRNGKVFYSSLEQGTNSVEKLEQALKLLELVRKY